MSSRYTLSLQVGEVKKYFAIDTCEEAWTSNRPQVELFETMAEAEEAVADCVAALKIAYLAKKLAVTPEILARWTPKIEEVADAQAFRSS